MQMSKPTDKQDKPARSGSKNILEIRQSKLWQGVSYQLQKRGKQGAYWYAFYHDGGKGRTVCKYLGKEHRELTEADF